MARFVLDLMVHLDVVGGLASFEGPRQHGLTKLPLWTQVLGTQTAPTPPWQYSFPDGCMYACRSPGEFVAPINKPYMLVANFPMPLMTLQCRNSVVRIPFKLSEYGLPRSVSLAAVGEKSVASPADAADDLIKEIDKGGPRSSGGVSTNVQQLSDAERAARHAKRVPAIEAAQKFWRDAAQQHRWNEVRTPAACFRFTGEPEAASTQRRSAEYAEKILTTVGLSGAAAGYQHLSPDELAALREVIQRKAPAFWIDGMPRCVMRGFKHDVLTTGLPVRGRPIRLKGPEAEFVREELEANVTQGLYTRGMSPWGSWAFPTKVSVAQRRRRTVIDYRMVNSRLQQSVYYIRRCCDVKADLVGRALLSGFDGARGFNLLVNTARAREVLAVLSDSGCFLPKVLQLGPSTGPFDFQYCTDELFTSAGRTLPSRQNGVLKGQSRYGNQWKNYLDDHWIATGRWIDGRGVTDAAHAARLREIPHKAPASRPVTEALSAAGLPTTRAASRRWPPEAAAFFVATVFSSEGVALCKGRGKGSSNSTDGDGPGRHRGVIKGWKAKPKGAPRASKGKAKGGRPRRQRTPQRVVHDGRVDDT
jgi:hypothetical protein